MNATFKKISGLGLILALCFAPALSAETSPAKRQPKKKELPKGVVKWDEARYPVYIFQPEAFKTAEIPQGIVVISGEPEKKVAEWKDAADHAGLLLVSANFEVLDKDVSEKADEWLLNLTRQIGLQYKVKNFYLIGEGTKAHYAAYLGLKYPAKFAGVAAIGSSWVGPFEQMVRYTDNEKKQTMFFIAMQQDNEQLEETKVRTEELRKKGYAVELIILEKAGEEKSDNLKADALMWLQSRAARGAAPAKPLNVTQGAQPVKKQAAVASAKSQSAEQKAGQKVEEVKKQNVVAASQPAADTTSPTPKKSKWKTKVSEFFDDFFAV